MEGGDKVIFNISKYSSHQISDLLVMTVASEENSLLSRFRRSVQVNGLTLEVFGLGETWQGLGYKVTRLAMALEKYKDDVDKIILFSDAHDVLIDGPAEQFLAKFRRFNARIVFAAETNCWPPELKSK